MAIALATVAIPATAVADDPNVDEQPLVFNTTLTPDSLPQPGGTATVTAEVIEDVGLTEVYADVVGSDGSYQKVPMALQSGTVFDGIYSGAIPLPANTTGQPITYTVAVWAVDDLLTPGGDPAGTVTVGATPPSAALLKAPDKVSFGDVRVGGTHKKAIEIRNNGRKKDGPLGFRATTSAPFAIVGAEYFEVAPGKKVTVIVAFRPTATGDAKGALALQRADGGQAGLAVPLTGRGRR
jgi:hypothetical protein